MNILRFRYRRFHESQLLLWLAVGILMGLVIGNYTAGTNSLFFMIAIVTFFGAMKSKRWWALIVICLAGLLIGFVRGSDYRTNLTTYDSLVGQKISMVGKLAGDAQDTSKGTTKIVLKDIVINDRHYVGEVFVTTAGREKVKRGDIVQVTGKIRDGFASYPVSMSYAKLDYTKRNPDLIRDVRESFSSAVRKYVIEPMASLGLGFVVGQRSTLPDELDEQLKIVGLTHIVVASGYNLTILVRFMMRIAGRHSRYIALVGSLALMFCFASFSGFSPSMNRAVVVTLLGLLAWYVGRRFHPMYLLLYTASGTALFNPMYVWADLGWYLSFFAFAGVLILAPIISARLYQKRQPTAFEQLIVETMSAQVMALPIIALAFGVIPVFGLVANVMVAPVIPLAMALTALTGILAMTAPVLGALLAVPTTIVIAYVIAIVEWLSAIPSAQLQVDIPLFIIVIWYGLTALLCVRWMRTTGYNFRKIYKGSQL